MGASLAEALEQATNQELIVVSMVIPAPVFKMLNVLAVKQGKTAAALVSEALREKIEKLAEEDLPKEKDDGRR